MSTQCRGAGNRRVSGRQQRRRRRAAVRQQRDELRVGWRKPKLSQVVTGDPSHLLPQERSRLAEEFAPEEVQLLSPAATAQMEAGRAPMTTLAEPAAGYTSIEQGTFISNEDLRLVALHGTYVDPNAGLVTQNYVDNRTKDPGIGNCSDEGFAAMEKATPIDLAMFKRALALKGVKVVVGTDGERGTG